MHPRRPQIICQLGFLEKFLQKCEGSLTDILLDRKPLAETFTACYRLLDGDADIYMDASPEELVFHPHPVVKKLIKKPTQPVRCRPSFKQELATDELWAQFPFAVFLLDSDEQTAETIENDWGVAVLTPGNLEKKGNVLLMTAPVFVKRGDPDFSWDILAFSKHCFHSVVVIDNYLEAKESSLKTNLIPLLQTLLKTKPRKRQLHLTVITTSEGIPSLHSALSKLLAEAGLEAEVRVAKTQKHHNHDRHIITNQLWLTSGFGFSLTGWRHDTNRLETLRDTIVISMPVFGNETVEYSEEEDAIYSYSACFAAVTGILGRVAMIDANATTDRGTEIWSKGPKGEFVNGFLPA